MRTRDGQSAAKLLPLFGWLWLGVGCQANPAAESLLVFPATPEPGSHRPETEPETELSTGSNPICADLPPGCHLATAMEQLEFGGVVPGTAKRATWQLANVGDSECHVLPPQMHQAPAAWEMRLVRPVISPLGLVIRPGKTLEWELEYLPLDLGPDQGRFTVQATNPPQTIMLEWKGTGAATVACELRLGPSPNLALGPVGIGQKQIAHVVFENRGYSACTIHRMELEQGTGACGFSLPTSLPMIIAERGQDFTRVEMELAFVGEVAGQHRCRWKVFSDATVPLTQNPDCPAGPGEGCLELEADGGDAPLQANPTELTFPRWTPACREHEQLLTIRNTSDKPQTIARMRLEPDFDPAFQLRHFLHFPMTADPKSATSAWVRFRPDDNDVHWPRLILEDEKGQTLLMVPLVGWGEPSARVHRDRFKQGLRPKTDMLFVVDNSQSMVWARENLVENFRAFIHNAATRLENFHFGVISSEIENAYWTKEEPRLWIQPGLLTAAPGRPRMQTLQTPDLFQAFEENTRVGHQALDEHEAPLEAARLALSEPRLSDPDLNGCFSRADARLQIVSTSDGEDHSSGTLEEYIAFFKNLKGERNEGLLSISTITAGCPEGGCRAGSDPACVSARSNPPERLAEIARLTKGLHFSLCDPNWYQALDQLGLDATLKRRAWTLSLPAEPDSIQVQVDQNPIPAAAREGGDDGWTFYPEDNTVFFGGQVVPDLGSHIDIEYTPTCPW